MLCMSSVLSDIDECTNGTHNCSDEEVCINLFPGTFTCECARGYERTATGELHVCQGEL